MIIRREEEKDYFENEALVREAFYNIYRPGYIEHYVLHKLRNDKCFMPLLDYVIEEDGKIIASIVYAIGKLTYDDNTNKNILTFGPVNVHPKYQKKGYAEKLINYTMDKAKSLGYNEIIISGNEEYYKKYGFVKASLYNIYYKGYEEDDSFLLIRIFDESKYENEHALYSDPECYMVNEEVANEYDKNFPYKEKVQNDNQLF